MAKNPWPEDRELWRKKERARARSEEQPDYDELQMAALSPIKLCSWHRPDNTGNYIAWSIQAEKWTDKGITQTQCQTCKRWLFPKEWGKEPK